jgi:hypothetical protein
MEEDVPASSMHPSRLIKFLSTLSLFPSQLLTTRVIDATILRADGFGRHWISQVPYLRFEFGD